MSEFLASPRNDLRLAARQLRRNLSLALAAVSSLALGIGATTSMFSVVNAVLFRPLPFAESDRLVRISEGWSKLGTDFHRIASPNIVDFDAARGRAFESLGLVYSWGASILTDGDAELVPAARVTPSFFQVLRVRPAIGRLFEPADSATGAPVVAIITDSYWRRHYGGDPNAVGKTLSFAGGGTAQIVGVMASSFRFPYTALQMTAADILTPLAITPGMAAARGNSYDATAIARLRDGASLATAQAALDDIMKQFPARYPDSYGKMASMGGRIFVHVIPLGTAVNGDARQPLLLLLGAVGFLLLVACINVAGLFAARTTARRREFDVRRALGATRRRLTQQLFAEALLVVAIAGVLGVALGWWGAKALVAAAPNDFYRAFDIALDWRVTLVTIAITFATAFAFALAPGLTSDSPTRLGDDERSPTSAPVRARARRVLIVAEIALALMLTVGAGLMIRSFARARAVDPGFDPTNVMTFGIGLPPTRFTSAPLSKTTELQVLEQLRGVAGVKTAGAGTPLPMTWGWSITFTPQGPPLPALPMATNAFVLPGFLETLGVRLRAGRTFTDRDNDNAPPVVMVNETLARRYFDGNALGRQIKWGGTQSPNRWMTVIGIVADVKHDRLDGDPQPSLYMPVLQGDSETVGMFRFLSYVVRLDKPEAVPMRELREAVRRVDPQLAIVAATPMDALVGHSIATRRFNALLLALFSGLALVLAATGVYGLLQYSVVQRTREIGVRVAIGARPANVMQLVIGDAMRLAVIGVALGVAGALVLTRVMRALLFATSPVDGVTFVVAATVLLLASLAASFFPTRRALSIDPVSAIRAD